MNRIKFLREELNMTQQELADKLNGAKSTVAMYEKGDRKPSMEVLLKLSEIFDCSIDYLLGKSDIRNPEDFDENKLYFALSQEDKGYISEEVKNDILRYAKFVIEEEKKKKKK